MKPTIDDSTQGRLIFALDVGEDFQRTLAWVDRLKDHVDMFKVGKEAFTLFGPSIVSAIRKLGGKVFLDLKFHDIPNTVARAAEVVAAMNVSMFTVHASGGQAMMRAAVEAVSKKVGEDNGASPIILAVTVLTSLDDAALKEIGFSHGAAHCALHLAKLARAAGVSGVVASAHDGSSIRKACGPDFLIVTPGVRMGDAITGDDQKRVLTPREAVAGGADYVVVGRPIRCAHDPAMMADMIRDEIRDGLSMRAACRSPFAEGV